MSAINRVLEYFKSKGIKASHFANENDIASGYFSTMKSRNGKLGEDVLRKLALAYPDLDIAWVITGVRAEKRKEVAIERSNELNTLHKYLIGLIRQELTTQSAEEMERLQRNVSNLSARLQLVEGVLNLDEGRLSQNPDADSKNRVER